jgi:hypothetical protein
MMMSNQAFEKTLLSSLGYGVMAGFWFGIKYHSLLTGLLASLLCAGLYAGMMLWRLKSA